MRPPRLIFALSLLFSGTVHAEQGVLVHTAVFYGDFLSQYGANTSAKDSSTVLQADIGYVWANNLHLGLRHSNETQKVEVITKNDGMTTVSASDSSVRTGTGLVAGYHAANGLSLDVSYLALNVKNRMGSDSLLGGYALSYDLGYRIKVGSFAVGPQLSMTTFYYKKEKSGGVTSNLEGTWREQHVLPYLALWIYL